MQELVKKLEEQKLVARDYVVPTGSMRSLEGNVLITMPTDGALQSLLKDTGIKSTNPEVGFTTNSVSDQHLADKCGIPKRYYDRMKGEAPDLFDRNVNHWLGERNARQFVRVFQPSDENGGLGVLRGILSDSYFPIDNLDLLIATLETVQSMGVKVKIDHCDLTERRMNVKFYCPEIKDRAKELLENYRVPGARGDESGVFTGFVLGNSEVGHGSFIIAPRLYVGECRNGLTFYRDKYARTHLGAKMGEDVVEWSQDTKRKNLELVISQIKDAVRTFASDKYLGRVLAEIAKANEHEYADPGAAVEAVAEDFGYTDERKARILSNFIKGGITTGWGLSQAVTYAAHEVADGDDAFEVERAGSEIITNHRKYGEAVIPV